MVSTAWLSFLLVTVCARIASAKIALAHFMVQEAYAYTNSEWQDDIAAAQQMGLDGFALNWSPPDCSSPSLDWMVTQIDNAFTAAQGTGFQLMHSFDMSYTTCQYNWNQTFMQSMIQRHASSDVNLRWNTNILVSSFGGDASPPYGNEFLQGLKTNLKNAGTTITLAPSLTTYSEAAQDGSATAEASKLVSDYPSIDGFLNWQAWPTNGENLTTTVDQAFKSALTTAGRTGPYIMAISPWQFKNLNETTGSWVAYSDTLFAQRLQDLATSSFEPDIVELLTWNDYGESHYLRDLPSSVVTSADYVTFTDGMSNYVHQMAHAPWRIIAKYYLSWWKNGSAPAITMDQVVFWYRVHPRTATCTGQPDVDISGSQYPDDAVFAWALVSAPSTVQMTVGSNQNWTFTANATGPAMNMVPFPSDLGSDIIGNGGVAPVVDIVRDGEVIQTTTGSVPITNACLWYNFNPVVNLVGPGVNH